MTKILRECSINAENTCIIYDGEFIGHGTIAKVISNLHVMVQTTNEMVDFIKLDEMPSSNWIEVDDNLNLVVHPRLMFRNLEAFRVWMGKSKKIKQNMRKYNISETTVLQNISQIKTVYKDTWEALAESDIL